MKIAYSWLRELTGVEWSVQEMADRLTLCGTACEYTEHAARFMSKVVVGEVIGLAPVPGADKIRIASVNLGGSRMDVVCGAPNVELGQKVPVALEGAELAGGMVIKRTKIRGVESSAMICSERELGISDSHVGIMVLDPDTAVGIPLAEAIDFDDYTMTFELTPNRPDSMSAIGIARDLAALAMVSVRRPQVSLAEIRQKASEYISVRIEDPVGCPRYAARVIKNVRIGESPWWLKKKLLLSGIRPISNAVDITNFVLLEMGHPLHAFDYDRFGSKEVVVRKAKNGEKFTTLDGTEHTLTPEVLLITNGKEGVAAGGVMGGLNSEIEDSTTTILLEAAYFDSPTVRRSRKKLGLVTESSSRFEKGADPEGVYYALDRAAELLHELCGGEVLSGIVDCYPKRIEPKVVTLRPERCNYVLGTEYSSEEMKEILENLEFEVTGNGPFTVKVPTFRPDVEREIDLVEEVVRIKGYSTVPDAVSNIGPLYTPRHYYDKYREEMRQILTAAGYDEIVHHGLADSRKTELIVPGVPAIKIVNPVSDDLDIMRTSLIPTILGVVSHNISHRTVDLQLFEIGKVYFPPGEKRDWEEKLRLSMAVSGSTPHTWRDRPRALDFYDLSGAVSELAKHFGWNAIQYVPKAVHYLESGLSFEILVSGRPVGIIGQVNSSTARKFDFKQDVTVAEIEIEELMGQSGKLVEYDPLPVYPSAPRDLAMVVEETVKAGDLVAAIKGAAGEIAESVEIFDVYTGKQIEKGKKSVAISINYRSLTGSLSAEQVEDAQRAVVKRLNQEFNALIRDK